MAVLWRVRVAEDEREARRQTWIENGKPPLENQERENGCQKYDGSHGEYLANPHEQIRERKRNHDALNDKIPDHPIQGSDEEETHAVPRRAIAARHGLVEWETGDQPRGGVAVSTTTPV